MPKPRKNGPRTKRGRLSRAYSDPRLRDMGTDEARAKRQALVGQDADPSLAATMLGVLYARRRELFELGQFEREHYDEGMEFRRLRCALYGLAWPSNVAGGEASEERLEKLHRRFNAMCSRLTLLQRIVLANVAVFDRQPVWFHRHLNGLSMRVVDALERKALLDGLNRLLENKRQKKAA